MRILFSVRNPAYVRHYESVLRGLAAQGHDVQLVTRPRRKGWQQPDEAKNLVKKGIPVKEALIKFANFVNKNDLIWAKGPDYDLVMINAAYGMLGMRCPFSFRNARCVRTRLALGRSLGLPNIERKGIKHFALDDAVYQAEQIIKVTNHVQQLTMGLDKATEFINLW